MCVKTRLMSAADGARTWGDGTPSPRLPKPRVCPPPGLMKAAEFLMHFAASVTLVSPHHSRRCKIKQKQSGALMNRLAQEKKRGQRCHAFSPLNLPSHVRTGDRVPAAPLRTN